MLVDRLLANLRPTAIWSQSPLAAWRMVLRRRAILQSKPTTPIEMPFQQFLTTSRPLQEYRMWWSTMVRIRWAISRCSPTDHYDCAVAVSLTRPPPGELLSIPIASIERDLWVNTLSPLLAAQHAVQGFEELPATAKKVFIYTGNILNSTVLPVPAFFTLGIGKAASAYWLGASDLNYSKKGFRYV